MGGRGDIIRLYYTCFSFKGQRDECGNRREFLARQPFQPLQVHLSNGEIHQIRHPEFAMLLKSTLVIGIPDSDRVICCALLHIASIERRRLATQTA